MHTHHGRLNVRICRLKASYSYMGRGSATRGVQRLQMLMLVLSWQMLCAPARGALFPMRGVAGFDEASKDVLNAAKVEPAAVMWLWWATPAQPGAGTAAATGIPPKGLSVGHNLSTSRRLLQPPGLPPAARDITLQELLANIDVSAGNGGVRVALPSVPPPNKSSGSNSTASDDKSLPPVVVNIKLSDLFPPEPHGRKLLSSSSSSSSSSSRSAGTGLSGYMRNNPTVAPELQELTGGRRNPSLSDNSDAKSVKLCDLFTDSSCTAAGARRKLLRGHVGRMTPTAQVAQRMQHMTAAAQQLNTASSGQRFHNLPAAAAGQRVKAAARRSLQQRDNLTTNQAEGLASWARQAPDSDVQYVQAIVGGGFIGRAQSTPQLTIDQVVGPQQASSGPGGRRKAARKLLMLLPPVVEPSGSAGGSSMVSSISGRTLLDGNGGAGGGAGAGTAAAAGGGAAEHTAATGSNAAGAGAGEGAGVGSNAQHRVTASSGSGLDLSTWAKGASPQDVQAVKAIGGSKVIAPSPRLSAKDVKLSDVDGR